MGWIQFKILDSFDTIQPLNVVSISSGNRVPALQTTPSNPKLENPDSKLSQLFTKSHRIH